MQIHAATGRIIEEHKTQYTILSEGLPYIGVVRGAFHHEGNPQEVFPKVGDYVTFTPTGETEAVIESVLPRTSVIVRSVLPRGRLHAHATTQVIVANVDIIFIVMGLDGDFNVSRAERYALLAAQSKVNAVVFLNKCDLVADPSSYLEKVKQRLPHVPVHVVSAATGKHMECFLTYLNADTTAVLLGSSGAGKSTITNWLMHEQKLATQEVREDDSRGRHTTTFRQLFPIPTGGYLIDTPGMRELGVASSDEDEAEVFADVDTLAAHCRYADCDHEKSDGCAILHAIDKGVLDTQHFASYLKLQREREYVQSKADEDSERQYKDKKKKLHKSYGNILKRKAFERDL